MGRKPRLENYQRWTMKKLFLILIALISALALFACSGEEEGEGYRVQLVASKGAEIVGDNPVFVSEGGTAEFTVKLGETVAYRGVTSGGKAVGAEYDPESGKLTVSNIRGNTRLQFNCEDVGYDTSAKLEFGFVGGNQDTSSHQNGRYYAGTLISLSAKDTSRVFDGWSYGGPLSSGGTLISTERDISFDLSEKYANSGMCYVFANYSAAGLLKYDVNGGVINYSSENLKATKYYTVTQSETVAHVKFNADWYEEVGAPYTFWDDGSFTREGYVLMEYNTKADGTGTGYSLGSKYPMDEGAVLYCIWAEDTRHGDFQYKDVTVGMPEGSGAALAPNFVTDGIMITGYIGNADVVTIPEKIGDKFVIAIGEGAFVNKSFHTLVLNRRIAMIEDGAFAGCNSLTTLYYPDGIAYVSNDIFDSTTYSNFKHFYVNATIAPRFSKSEGGCFAKKFTRLLSSADKKRIIVISGSSSYCGLSTEYLEALIDNEDYAVINFGTTRTTQIYMYLEAMKGYAKEGDIILYAPENSIYEMGEPRLYWKTLRDLEGMYNIFRYVDISGYENIFGAFREFNTGSTEGAYDFFEKGRYVRVAGEYGDVVLSGSFNELGEYNTSQMEGYLKEENYKAVYEITLNNRFKSILEGEFSTANPAEEDWRTSEKWCSADEAVYLANMNRAIAAAKSSGAKVYFTFAPIDYDAVTADAKASLATWCDEYELFIKTNYCFDGVLGETEDYIFNHIYFYNNAFHPNNYGRVYRTYQMYLDLCPMLGVKTPYKVLDKALYFEGCAYEKGATNGPVTPAIPE